MVIYGNIILSVPPTTTTYVPIMPRPPYLSLITQHRRFFSFEHEEKNLRGLAFCQKASLASEFLSQQTQSVEPMLV